MNETRRTFMGGAAAGAVALAAGSKIASTTGPRFVVAALTMLDRRGRLDDALNKDYLAFLAEGGADGALVMGTTGEFSSFSVKERKQALESFMRHRGKLSIMSQVGTSNIPETLELLDHAASAGAGSALVLPPYYFKNPSVDGLAAFFQPVLDAAKIPVLLYNIPQLSGAAITSELLHRLSKHERLYGMKDSFSKADPLIAFIKEFPKLKIMTGVTSNMAAALQAGGAGALTGNGSLYLRETRAIFEAFKNGGDAAAAQARFNEANKSITGYDSIPAMKFALSRKGLRESAVRPPFVELSQTQKKDIAGKLDRQRS